jgi:hypothetical protein
MVIYKIFVFGADRKSNMAARASHVCFKLTYWFQRRRLLNIFSIGSYVKIKSSHGGHLEFPSKFEANMAWMVLKWSIFKIVSGDPDLHPRWLPSADSFNIGPYEKKMFAHLT